MKNAVPFRCSIFDVRRSIFCYIAISYLLFAIGHSLFAQTDSVRYSQEAGTLQKQRFIDQYDYVFMTKEPAKWMVKATLQPSFMAKIRGLGAFGRSSGPETTGTLSPLWLSVERKLSPSFSLQIGGAMHAGYFDAPYLNSGTTLGIHSIFQSPGRSDNWILSSELKWYYGMKKRISEGLSANNFSGNYLSLRYDNIFVDKASNFGLQLVSNGKNYWFWEKGDKFYAKTYGNQRYGRISLNYGVQRRFLGHGVIDFGIMAGADLSRSYIQNVHFPNGDNSVESFNNDITRNRITSVWQKDKNHIQPFLITHVNIGLAWGDFKKAKKAPLCDVLMCSENVQSMFKVSWPSLMISKNVQNLITLAAYEHKLGQSPFSINYQTNIDIFRTVNILNNPLQIFDNRQFDFTNTNINFSVQPRFYFGQMRRIRQYGGNNLSGTYLGLNASLNYSYSNFKEATLSNIVSKRSWLEIGPVIGVQRKIFKNGYVDLNIIPSKIIGQANSSNIINFRGHFGFGFAF